MKIRIEPDVNKARALIKTAEITLERLKTTDILKYSSNALNDYYDILHNLMDALSFVNGVKVKGDGAHAELIDYISDILKFSVQTRDFLQKMREYRNRISYEGFMVNSNYIKQNERTILEIVDLLFGEIKGRIYR